MINPAASGEFPRVGCPFKAAPFKKWIPKRDLNLQNPPSIPALRPLPPKHRIAVQAVLVLGTAGVAARPERAAAAYTGMGLRRLSDR